MKSLVRALGVLAEPPDAAVAPVAAALGLPAPEGWQYDDLFLQQLYPHAAVYLGPEGKLGGEAQDRAAGVWRALGVPPPAEPDHLASLLGLYARIFEAEEADEPPGARSWEAVRRGFVQEHLLSWLPVWLARLEELASDPYRAWGRLLGRWLRAEALVGAGAGLPSALRTAPGLGDPEEVGGREFVDRLLAPVRSGFILARDDLARAAADSGLGLRVGERRWVLGALMSQDAIASLGWLADEAERQAALLAGWPDDVTLFWRDRAAATAATLRRAAVRAAEAVR